MLMKISITNSWIQSLHQFYTLCSEYTVVAIKIKKLIPTIECSHFGDTLKSIFFTSEIRIFGSIDLLPIFDFRRKIILKESFFVVGTLSI